MQILLPPSILSCPTGSAGNYLKHETKDLSVILNGYSRVVNSINIALLNLVEIKNHLDYQRQSLLTISCPRAIATCSIILPIFRIRLMLFSFYFI